MAVSQKAQYALRATFELGKRLGSGVAKIGDVAQAQAIPPRFLEVILNQLKQGGFVESRRGVQGGYLLAKDPADITVGEILKFIDGPSLPVRCIADAGPTDCPLHGRCAFMGLWQRAAQAVSGVYDKTTIADLIEDERSAPHSFVDNYCI
jgi:Rrf2 family transcriptional regulator, cysteine metabolism repressor